MHSIFQSDEYLPIQMLLYIFNVFIMIVASTLMLERKYSVKKTMLLSILIIYICLFPYHFDNLSTWFLQITILATPVTVVALFKDKLHIKILSSIISTLIIMGADYFAFFISGVLLGNVDTYKNKYESYLISIVSLILFAIIYVMIWNKFYKRSISVFFKNNLVLFFALIFIQLVYIILSVSEYYTIQRYLPVHFKKSEISFIFVYLMLFITTDIIILFFTKSSSVYHKIQTEREMLKYQNKLQAEYYEKTIKSIDQTAKLRHDINNIVQVINIQLNENTDESCKKAKKLADEITRIMDNTKVHKFCDNRIIDTVLFDKSNLAKKHSIKIVDDIIISEDINIDDFDLCRIFINLLDNAINATQNHTNDEEKLIYISCKENNEFVYIKCVNPTLTDIKIAGIKTPAKNSSSHGYGLKIIEDIAEKYNGTFTAKNIDNTFTTLIALKK